MFNRRFSSKDTRTPPENMTYSPPDSDQPETEQLKHPRDLDAGRVKEMCGFDADDPNVNVMFIPMGRGRLDDILVYGLGGVTADGNMGEVGKPQEAPHSESAEQIMQRLSPAIDQIMAEVREALTKAITKHAPMHGPHEGYAVILEELEELWDEIKLDGGGRDRRARKEALQVAAMGLRYLLDIDPR